MSSVSAFLDKLNSPATSRVTQGDILRALQRDGKWFVRHPDYRGLLRIDTIYSRHRAEPPFDVVWTLSCRHEEKGKEPERVLVTADSAEFVDIETHAKPKLPEVEEAVITAIRTRRDAGRKKYGTTMERTDLTVEQWITHAQQEALDLAIYLEKLKRVIPPGTKMPA